MTLDLPRNRELFGQADVRETVLASGETSYLSVPGQVFTSRNPDTDDVAKDGAGIVTTGNAIVLFAPVYLPHGAVVTACIVHGNAGATDTAWSLAHSDFAGTAGTTMATANVETADTSITDPTIDNTARLYYVGVDALAAADAIYGAIITYTT